MLTAKDFIFSDIYNLLTRTDYDVDALFAQYRETHTLEELERLVDAVHELHVRFHRLVSILPRDSTPSP